MNWFKGALTWVCMTLGLTVAITIALILLAVYPLVYFMFWINCDEESLKRWYWGRG